jgi:glyoxylase-like metal-dependent hydrolase (beta-lactamase superfamily II)
MKPHSQSPTRFDLGGCTATLISGGSLRMDGGAMFGIIPKALWTRSTPADEQNRIEMACNCLLVEWQRETARRVIVETGHGSKLGPKEQKIWAIDPQRWLLPSLQALNVDPASITDVVVSHLHFDHAGGLTCERDGRLAPCFPHARVHVQRQEYEDARDNFGITSTSYPRENLDPIDQAGAWNLLDGEVEIIPGVRTILTPGHTRGHQAVLIAGRDRSLAFGGDTMPTVAHLGPAYNMSYDLSPLDNRASKYKLLQMLAQRESLLLIDHEPRTPAVAVRASGDWFELEPRTE